jgi:uncharacterized protein YbdZ (MbtH family)
MPYPIIKATDERLESGCIVIERPQYHVVRAILFKGPKVPQGWDCPPQVPVIEIVEARTQARAVEMLNAVGHDGEIRIADRVTGTRNKWGVFKLRRGVSATVWDRVGTYTFTSKRNCVAFINTHWGQVEL